MKNDLLEEHVRYGEARFRDKNIVRPFVNRIYQDLAELEEAIKPKTCEWCKWEQETKLITTKVGDKVDICKLCTRYENLQDHYEVEL